MSRGPKVFATLFLLGLAVTGLPLSVQTLAQEGGERVDSNPVWSPDGTRIAFQSIPMDDYLAGVNAGATEYNDDIWVMKADGTNQVDLTPESPRMDVNPVWSPDASAIAFVSKRSGNFDIWVMGADGSNPTDLTPQNLRADVEPHWSPDGRWIAYVAENIRQVSYDIWLVEPSGRNPRKLTHWENHLYGSFTWSPDSNAIAFTSRESTEEIQSPEQSGPDGLWIMKLDGSEPVRIIPDRLYLELAWCPCSTVLAATLLVPVELSSEIWLVAVDGSQLTNLANVTPDVDHSPVWSPDGTRIAFTSRRPGFALSRDIWVMNADGSEPMNLTSDFGFANEEPSWSPYGSQIAFTSWPVGSIQVDGVHYDFDFDAGIWVMNADGSNPVNLAAGDQ